MDTRQTGSLGGMQLGSTPSVPTTNQTWPQPQQASGRGAAAAPQPGGVEFGGISQPQVNYASGPAGSQDQLWSTSQSGSWSDPSKSTGGFSTPGWQYGVGPSGPIQAGVDNNEVNTGQIGWGGTPVNEVNQGQEYYDRMQNAYYDQARARLDPRFQQEQSALEAQLQNMGLTRGSEAWNREMQNMAFNKNDAYSQAMNQAIMMSGQEAARMQGMDINAGNFANQAAQQNFANLGQQQQWENQALGQEFAQGMQQGQFQNAAQAQQYQQMLEQAKLNNAALGTQGQIEAQKQAAAASQAQAAAQVQAASQQAAAQLALGNRQADLAERQWDFNAANQMRFGDLAYQNALMEGMYPGDPSYGGFSTPDFGFNPNYGSTGAAQGAYNTNQGINWGNVIGSLGGLFI